MLEFILASFTEVMKLSILKLQLMILLAKDPFGHVRLGAKLYILIAWIQL